MCGIAGFIDFNKQLSGHELQMMTNAILHRGPDGDGHFFTQEALAHIGLGHRRLSVIDLSDNASQPMFKHGLQIIFNGEIYNYKEIRKELISLGYSFQTDSDTEVILSAFDHWGNNAVEKFIGMFVFIIWDTKRKKLIIFRDRAGVKPLYIYNNEGLILFASELKSFHAIPKLDLTINQDALVDFFRWGYIPTPKCIFTHCKKMKQGSYMTINLETKEVVENTFWDIFDFVNKVPQKLDEKEVITETESLLQSAFNYRMVADVPVGVFLSGGYDSSLVAALIQKERTKKIKTFTIGFENPKFNEANFAKQVAKHIGTDHYELLCNEEETKDIINKLPDIYDEPFADSSAIPTYLVSKMARKEVTVALSADGGDEQFIGYNRYRKALKLAQFMQVSPKFLQELLAKGIFSIFPNNDIYCKIGDILKNNKISDIPIIQTTSLRTDSLANLFLKNPTKSQLFTSNSRHNNSIFATEYQQYMQDDILAKIDRAAMAVSLEGREPLLDHRIAEWVMQLPVSIKYKNNTLKYILKEITHKYIPKKIMDRPKKGFGIPINQWLKDDLSYLLDRYLDKERIKIQGIFNPVYIEHQKLIFQNQQHTSSFIWHMLVFQMWFDKWMTKT